MDDTDIQQFIELELSLLTALVRSVPDRLEELIDPEFREIGASGRLWNRPEAIGALSGTETAGEPIEATEFEVTAVTADVVLVTFLTVGMGRRARRSSLWRRTGGRWRVLHHQGTPVP